MSQTPAWTLRPEGEVISLSLRWTGLLTVLFVAVYGSLNWLSAQRADRWRLWFEWELAIPLVPWMAWAYLSLFASFFLPMFVLDAPRIHALCRRLAFATVASGACFLFFPAELGFTRLAQGSQAGLALGLIHRIDLPHNLAPSLHVSWSLILLCSMRASEPSRLRWRIIEIVARSTKRTRRSNGCPVPPSAGAIQSPARPCSA
jgi:hypothetical protein